MRKRLVCLILISGVLTSCSMGNAKESQKVGSNEAEIESVFKENNEPKDESNLNDNEYSHDSIVNNDISDENDDLNIGANEDENKVDEENTSSYKGEEENSDISDEIKNYIVNGQGYKIEVDKVKWSERFLDQLDVSSLYEKYIGEGGDSKSFSDFAEYITLNAPIRNDWEELFRRDLYNIYNEEVVKIEHLEGDLYRAYVYKDGQEVPFVTVSSRTGYFHG